MAIKTTIIGLGIIGRRMLEHMRRHEGYAPDILWDPDPDACALALAEAPGACIVCCLRSVLAEFECQGVLV